MAGHYTTRLVAVLNIVGLGYFRENSIKIDYFNTYFSMEWNPPQKIEIKESVSNLLCNYSKFSLIK